MGFWARFFTNIIRSKTISSFSISIVGGVNQVGSAAGAACPRLQQPTKLGAFDAIVERGRASGCGIGARPFQIPNAYCRLQKGAQLKCVGERERKRDGGYPEREPHVPRPVSVCLLTRRDQPSAPSSLFRVAGIFSAHFLLMQPNFLPPSSSLASGSNLHLATDQEGGQGGRG